MRVIVACVPQTGHVRPLLPLARALAARGDDVVIATAADMTSLVEPSGLTVRPTGPGFSEWFARLAARTRGAPGDGLAPERVVRYFVPRLFGEIGTDLVVDDLLAASRAHHADLIVHDAMLYAGPLVAASLGESTNTGAVKVCKVAGSGVAVDTNLAFAVGGKNVTVPAGPADQGGYCKVVRGFTRGTRVKVTEAAKTGIHVARIRVQPVERLVSKSTANRAATVKIGKGYTVVTCTNAANTR